MIDQPFNIDSLPDVPLVDRGYGYEVGTELFLVRHGESMTNTYANLVAYDPNLTALGWAQALRAGDWMAEHTPVDVVVTSPMRRANSTALAIAQAQGLDLVQLPGLEEFSHSYWEEVPVHHPTRPWWGRTDWMPTLENAPSFIAFRDRVLQALSEILERYSGQRICVVSHGGTMSVLTAAMLGSIHFSIWNTNTGISQFMWPEWKRWMVHYLNRTEHLIGLGPEDHPRAPEASQNEQGFWHLPDRVVDSWTEMPANPELAFLSNLLSRNDRILFIRPPDPITPLRVSLRARRADILCDDLQALEAGELRRAALNANHIRYQYLFRPLPYPDQFFDYVVVSDVCEIPEETYRRVLKRADGLIRWRANL